MICTTVLIKIESTLANLVGDIEKEEAAAIKAYLRLAISNFAAADSSPSPPRVPTHHEWFQRAKQPFVLQKKARQLPRRRLLRIKDSLSGSHKNMNGVNYLLQTFVK
ncbi:hypothetical protein EV44_g2005 [Erysiphe necator]|uniref:Uncharacterized protein n=1 Tax=Uncinula necator TaxID=52586 RepID=A0A0B1P5Y7_UNCNE|nr:hypothetical protein EV44_g2005 [Erysiphe necator]